MMRFVRATGGATWRLVGGYAAAKAARLLGAAVGGKRKGNANRRRQFPLRISLGSREAPRHDVDPVIMLQIAPAYAKSAFVMPTMLPLGKGVVCLQPCPKTQSFKSHEKKRSGSGKMAFLTRRPKSG